jgi:ribosomal protein L44E
MAHPLDNGKLPQLSLKKKVRNCKWKTLSKATIKKGANVKKFKKVKLCTFTEYLKICKKYDCIAVVDVKNIKKSKLKKITKKIYKTIKKVGMTRKCFVISKSLKIVKEINKLSNHVIPVGIYAEQLNKIDRVQYKAIKPKIRWHKSKFSDDPITIKVKA